MPIYEYRCPGCEFRFEVIKKVEQFDTSEVCPECESTVTLSNKLPPSRIRGGVKKTHAQETAALQQSLRERFVTSGEMDQVKHKHGSEFHDSIRGAAVDRIKKEEGL